MFLKISCGNVFLVLSRSIRSILFRFSRVIDEPLHTIIAGVGNIYHPSAWVANNSVRAADLGLQCRSRNSTAVRGRLSAHEMWVQDFISANLTRCWSSVAWAH